MDKKAFRKETSARRSALSAEEVRQKSAAVVSHIRKLTVYENSHTVALYSPFRNEVDLTVLLEDEGKRFLFPKVVKGTRKLDFYHVSSLSQFRKGAYGILEPEDSLPKVSISEIDLFLAPGVGFSEKGERIGYGGGYYDTTLSFMREGSTVIGVCFDEQILPSGFSDTWDRYMDGVVADSGCLLISSHKE